MWAGVLRMLKTIGIHTQSAEQYIKQHMHRHAYPQPRMA
jgi:hypothetical protein